MVYPCNFFAATHVCAVHAHLSLYSGCRGQSSWPTADTCTILCDQNLRPASFYRGHQSGHPSGQSMRPLCDIDTCHQPQIQQLSRYRALIDMLIGLSWVPSNTGNFLLQLKFWPAKRRQRSCRASRDQEHLCNQDDMQSSVCLGEDLARDDSIAVTKTQACGLLSTSQFWDSRDEKVDLGHSKRHMYSSAKHRTSRMRCSPRRGSAGYAGLQELICCGPIKVAVMQTRMV